MIQDDDVHFLDVLKKLFKPKKIIEVGDVGIYKDILTINIGIQKNYNFNYYIYAKVKAISIYENLVEIELIDVMIMNPCDASVKSIIIENMPKYINPKHIKWKIS